MKIDLTTPFRLLSEKEQLKRRVLLRHMVKDVAFTYRMPFGIQGDISRPSIATVEAQVFGATAFPQYGIPAVLSAGKVVPVSATGQQVYGLLARPFPITGANASDPLGTSVPPTTGLANLLRRGYMTVFVQLNAATAALGVGVYIRYQNPVAGQIVGGLEAATTANNYLLTPALTYGGGTAYFMGPADANGFAEIGFNI